MRVVVDREAKLRRQYHGLSVCIYGILGHARIHPYVDVNVARRRPNLERVGLGNGGELSERQKDP